MKFTVKLALGVLEESKRQQATTEREKEEDLA